MADETLTGAGTLTDLKIDRVSYCWEGMNPLARIALYKRKPGSDSTAARKTATLPPHGASVEKRGDRSMPAPTPTLEDLTKTIEGMRTTVEKAERILKASKEEKAFTADMDEKKTEEFFAKTPEERKACMEKARTDAAAEAEKIEKAKASDETLTIDGATISKSANPALFAIVKSQQATIAANAAEIAKANDRAEMVTLTKRAGDEFKALPGTDDAKAAVLKHMKSAPAEVIATFEAMLKAGQGTGAAAFQRVGKGGDDAAKTGGDASARTVWKQKVQEVKKSHPDLTSEKVLEKAHDLYPAEFEAAYPDTAAAVRKSTEAAHGVAA